MVYLTITRRGAVKRKQITIAFNFGHKSEERRHTMESSSRKPVYRGPPPPYTEFQTTSDSQISVTISSGLPQLPPSYSDIETSIVLQPALRLHTELPFDAQPPGKNWHLFL